MVSVRRLEKSDVIQMVNWGKHKDLRLLHYNFNYKTDKECILWYKAKSKFLRKYIFGIYEEDKLLGYITLKNINWIIRKAEMGIVLNPSLVNNGIGNKAIKKYLKIVFDRYHMKSIFLKVAFFNIRAMKCYKKSGFVEYKDKYELYEEQDELLINERYKKFSEFDYKNGLIYTKYKYMRIKNEL